MKKLLPVLYLLFSTAFAAISAQPSCNACNKYTFIQNKGQWDSIVQYKTQIKNGALFFESNCITFNLFDVNDILRIKGDHHKLENYKPQIDYNFHLHALKMKFNGAQPLAVKSSEPIKEYFNYFIGNDKNRWAGNVHAYKQLNYPQLYNGINLQIFSQNGELKYLYEVKPGSSPNQINITMEGADGISITEKNDLLIKTSVGNLFDLKPYAYQIINGKQQDVPCFFHLNYDNTIGYVLPNGYDLSHTLYIDPTLVFSTYSGSTADNFGYSATYDSKGNAFAAGTVFGVGYPVTTGAYQMSYVGGPTIFFTGGGSYPGDDIGITKYSADGTQRIYSTYLGGYGQDLPHSLVVNSSDELYILGTTGAANFPTTTTAYDKTFGGGPDPGVFDGIAAHFKNGSDIFISRLSADGSQLLSSTYVGGSANDGINYRAGQSYSAPGFLRHNYADEVRGEIDIDDNNNVYVASCTRSTDFPRTTGTFQNTFGGGSDACVFKMDANLSTMIWSTTFGGTDDDAAYSVSIDSKEDLFVAGGTRSTNFPVTNGVLQSAYGGGDADGFITHIDKNGQQILVSTYYGFHDYDQIYFVELDKTNNVYVFGQADNSGTNYIKNAVYNKPNGGQFISKITEGLDNVVWSTSFGRGLGVTDISPTAFLVDVCSSIYACGWGSQGVNNIVGGTGGTTGLDVTPNAFKATTDGQDFYLMVLKDDASALTYATFMGGNISEEHVDGGTSRFDKKGVVYQSVCAGCGSNDDFPTTPGAVSNTNNSNNCNNAVFKFNLDLPICVADFSATNGCANAPINFNNQSVSPANPSYQWQFGDGGTSTQTNPSHSYTQSGVFTVTLVVTNPAACNFSDTITKQIVITGGQGSHNLPARVVCKGQSTQVGVTPGTDPNTTYLWSPATGLSSTTSANPVASPTQTTTYQLLVGNSGCIDTFFQTVTVSSATFNISSTNVQCPGDTIVLSITGFTGSSIVSYNWTPANIIVAGAQSSSPLAVPVADVTFAVTIETAEHCFFTDSLRFDFPDSVFSLQADFILPPAICAPDTVQFINSTNGTNGTTYMWQFTDNVSTSLVNPSRIFTNAGAYGVTLIAFDNNACNFSDTVTKTYLVIGDTSYTIGQQTICPGGSAQIGFTTLVTGLTYNWQPTTDLSNPNISNPIASPVVSTTYSLYLSNGTCTDTVIQQVNILYDSIYITANPLICSGTQTQLTVNNVVPTDTITYTWLPASAILSGGNTATPTVSINGTTQFTVSGLSQYGCLYYDTVTVGVFPSQASVNATATPDTITFGETSQLNADTANVTTFTWLPDTTLSAINITNPVASPLSTTTYYVQVNDENNCYKTDSVTVHVIHTPCAESNIYIPNAFSPNGDGKNEVLYVRGNNITKLYFAVYDRWGQKVFETTDINKGWDGRFKGKKLDPAVFGYYAEGECPNNEKFNKKGNVTLLK